MYQSLYLGSRLESAPGGAAIVSVRLHDADGNGGGSPDNPQSFFQTGSEPDEYCDGPRESLDL